MLDYDGTLAPFHSDRARALPPAGVTLRLADLARTAHTTIAIVSGRPLAELEPLIAAPKALLIGEHGWEVRRADGTCVRHPLAPAVTLALDRAERAARER